MVLKLFLILLYLALPLLLYLKKLHRSLIFWIILGIFVDIFSVQLLGNWSSLKLAGLALFPFTLKDLLHFIRDSWAGKFFALYHLWLVATFIVFAFIFPWENTTNFTRLDVSYLRGIRQLFTSFTELSLIIYLARQFADKEMMKFGTKSFLVSGLICAIGIYFEKIFHFDFFHFFTQGRELQMLDRMRGFTFEPRAASQYMAVLLLYILFYIEERLLIRFTLGLITLIAFWFTNSMSGLVLLAGGAFLSLALVGSLGTKSQRLQGAGAFILIVLIYGVFLVTPLAEDHLSHLFSRAYIATGNTIVQKFEIADSAVVNYFIHNPWHLIAGVGTGQASIATSPYLLDHWKASFPDGLSYLPFMGVTLILSNGGVIAITLLVVAVIFSFYGGKSNQRIPNHLLLFSLILLGLFFIQARYFHIFALALIFSTSQVLSQDD